MFYDDDTGFGRKFVGTNDQSNPKSVHKRLVFRKINFKTYSKAIEKFIGRATGLSENIPHSLLRRMFSDSPYLSIKLTFLWFHSTTAATVQKCPSYLSNRSKLYQN